MWPLLHTPRSYPSPFRLSSRLWCECVCVPCYRHRHIFPSLRKNSHLFTFRFAAHNASIYNHRTSLPPVRLRWWFKWLPAYKPLSVVGAGRSRSLRCIIFIRTTKWHIHIQQHIISYNTSIVEGAEENGAIRSVGRVGRSDRYSRGTCVYCKS